MMDPFKMYGKDWALVTAGSLEEHNSMTISWGSLGILWGKDIATVYVKPCRYTYEFMEKNDCFVLSFFDDSYKPALGIMGSKSGRDINKDKAAGLTPIAYKGVTLYKEAKLSIICKKIYGEDFKLEGVPEDAKKKYYEMEKPHKMYIGEILEIKE